MSNDLVNLGGYLPLVAGAELIRRQGALTQFDPFGYLNNLPQKKIILGDTFTSTFQQGLFSHVPDSPIPSYAGAQAYNSANTLQYVYPDGTCRSSVPSAIDWYPHDAITETANKKTTITFIVKVTSTSSPYFQLRVINGINALPDVSGNPILRANGVSVSLGQTTIGNLPTLVVGQSWTCSVVIDRANNRISGTFMSFAFSYTPTAAIGNAALQPVFGNTNMGMDYLEIST